MSLPMTVNMREVTVKIESVPSVFYNKEWCACSDKWELRLLGDPETRIMIAELEENELEELCMELDARQEELAELQQYATELLYQRDPDVNGTSGKDHLNKGWC